MAAGPRRCRPSPLRPPRPAPLWVRAAARRRSGLSRAVALPCAFAAPRPAEAAVRWALRQRGAQSRELWAFGGPGRRVERPSPRAEVAPEGIPEGNASLLLRDVQLRDEGTYSCAVSVGSLTAETTVQLLIEGNGTGSGLRSF